MNLLVALFQIVAPVFALAAVGFRLGADAGIPTTPPS
jgi:hypothetical protein